MRFPVFARRANPSIDRPIIRKSKSYVTEQVEFGRADWVDPRKPELGIVCREMLYFGEREIPVETVTLAKLGFTAGEIPGLRFVGPKPRIQLVASAMTDFREYVGAATA